MVKLSEYVQEVVAAARRATEEAARTAVRIGAESGGVLREQQAQGTTEYAILVGVLVVIAILAIVAFRDSLSNLWSAIADGINSL